MIDSRTRSRAMRQRRKNAGLCLNCGKRSAAPKKTRCSSCVVKQARKMHKKVKEATGKGFCNSCLTRPPVEGYKSCEICRLKHEQQRKNLRNKVLTAYGGECECCGEKETAFLDIDHINGNGNEHRRKTGRVGNAFFRILKREGFPPGYQVLCKNCNWGKYVCGGQCPHKTKSLIGGKQG